MRAATGADAARVLERFMPGKKQFQGQAPPASRGGNGVPVPPMHLVRGRR